jgi:hypothetical protein
MLSIVLGVFLLVTAGLKIHGLYTDPYSQESVLLTPRLLVAVIEVEILLGLWLLSGLAMRAAWLAALAFFAAGAAANVYLAVEGQRSCGCFGKLTVSPWWTLGLDAAVVMLLIIIRPAVGISTAPASLSLGVKTALSTGLVVALIGGGFVLLAEDPARTLAQLRGEVVAVSPAVTEVGEGTAGEQREFTIRLTNYTARPVRVLGGTTTCSCIATQDLPVEIAPNQSQELKVRIRFVGSPGRFQHRFALYTDSPETPWVVARFRGRVTVSKT